MVGWGKRVGEVTMCKLAAADMRSSSMRPGTKVRSNPFLGKDALMVPENEQSVDQAKDQASIRLLASLREKLLSGNISKARSAAHHLSWLQEDGLAILKEALFGNVPRTTKQAAAYGLRKVKGRMTKLALEVLEQGLQHQDRTTREACAKSLALMKGETPRKRPSGPRHMQGSQKIREVPKRDGQARLPKFRRASGNR
jgi:hypothetical protein